MRESWNPRDVPEDLAKEEFMMEGSSVGRFIGKNGSNIKALQEEMNVKISVSSVEGASGENKKHIAVLGAEREAVEAVRRTSEVVKMKRLCGRQNWRNGVLEVIRRMCGLFNIQVESNHVVLTGAQHSLNDIKDISHVMSCI